MVVSFHPWLKEQRPQIGSVGTFLGCLGEHADQLVLHPGLELWDLSESVRDLEPLQFADDLGGLHVLVEVDHLQSTLIGGKASFAGVSVFDHGEIGKVHAEEGQARRDTVLQPCTEVLLVLFEGHNLIDVCLGRLGLLRHLRPRSMQPGDGSRVQRGENRPERIVIVQFQALVGNLDPMFDDGCAFLDILELQNRIRHQIRQVVEHFNQCSGIHGQRPSILPPLLGQ